MVKFEKVKNQWICKNQITTLSYYDLEGSLEEVIKKLQSQYLPDGFKSIELEIEYPRYGDEDNRLGVWAIRPATELEIATLEKEAMTEEEQRRAYRKAQWLELNKEFGQ